MRYRCYYFYYSENRQKVAIKYNDNNNTVTYRENKYYTFDGDNSVGPETDKFITVNIPLMVRYNNNFVHSRLHKLHINRLEQKSASLIYKHLHLFHSHPLIYTD